MVAQIVKNLPAVRETQVQSLGQEDPLEKETATQYSCLENPMDRGAWWAKFMGSQRVRHDLATEHACTHTLIQKISVHPCS